MTLRASRGDLSGGSRRQDQPCPSAAIAAHSTPDSSRLLSAQGPGVIVRFRLRRIDDGLYVERDDAPVRGLRSTQSMLFRRTADLEAWCLDDPLRFELPLLLAGLRRESAALWNEAHDAPSERST